MATMLRLALHVLLFASMIASFPNAAHAKLRTGVPYYMVPYNWAIGGGVIAARVGNEYCPSTVTFAPETERGIPVIFSIPGGEHVFIDKDTDVHISFNHTFDRCAPKTLGPWGHPLRVPPPKVTFIDLYGFGSGQFLPDVFRIKKVDEFYKVVAYRTLDGGENSAQRLNIEPVFDNEHHIKSRLTLTPESPDGSPILFFIFEATTEDEGIKSVL